MPNKQHIITSPHINPVLFTSNLKALAEPPLSIAPHYLPRSERYTFLRALQLKSPNSVQKDSRYHVQRL